MTTAYWPSRPTTSWRLRLAALLLRCVRALVRAPARPRVEPHIEFADGVLYADGVRIGTLPVRRL